MLNILSFYPCKIKVKIGGDTYVITQINMSGTSISYTCEAYMNEGMSVITLYDYQFNASIKDKGDKMKKYFASFDCYDKNNKKIARRIGTLKLKKVDLLKVESILLDEVKREDENIDTISVVFLSKL